MDQRKNKMKDPMKQPLISVVIPCFNYAHFLPETLDSIINQTYTNWECIMVDDGSTDNTKDVAKSYIKKDKRFEYVHQSNHGLPSARNTGIRNAVGDYIQFLDADDFISPEKFETQLKALSNDPSVDIAYSEYMCFDNDDRNKTWTYSRVQLENNVACDFVSNWEKELSIPIHCFLYKKSCFDRWGFFDRTLIYGKEDWDLHINFSLAGAKYVFTKGIMAFYRVTPTSMARKTTEMTQGKITLFKKYLSKKDTPMNIKLILMERHLENDHINPVTRIYFAANYRLNKFIIKT